MPGSIICGVDDSESAKGAARIARELSARFGLRLVFVRVVHEDSPKKLDVAAERLQQLAKAATDLDCGADWLVEAGNPAERLVAAADDERASMIVVGVSAPRNSPLESVSASVVRRATCPVVVVPPVATANGTAGDRPPNEGELAGGIARFGLGGRPNGGSTDVAGGFARFTLGSGKN